MPPMPPAPGVLQLVIHSRDAAVAHDLINRLHVHYSGAAPTPAQLVTMAPTLLVEWASVFCPLMHPAKHVTGIDIIDLSSTTAAQTSLTGSSIGTRTGAAVPVDACVVVSGQVARRYRGGHPRAYLPLGTVTDLDGARQWNAALATDAAAAMISFMGVAVGAGWGGAGTLTPCNVSYFAGFHNVTFPTGRVRSVPTIRPGGPVVDTITTFVGRTNIGSQRRRLAA